MSVGGEGEGRSAGRVLLLTGAGGGIGSAIARLFYDEGASLALVDRDLAAIEALAAEFTDPERVLFLAADAGAPGESRAAVQAAHAHFGRLDDVVLGAGIYPEVDVLQMTDEQWDQVLRVNLSAAAEVARAAGLVLEQGGSIVGLTSIAGQRGSRGHAHYAASKAGMLAFLRSLALELAPRVRVNAVAPGTIETTMTERNRERSSPELLAATPLARYGRPTEVAAVVHFLCTPGAGFITGEQIAVNGGMHMA